MPHSDETTPAEAAYWGPRLTDLPALNLPTDRRRSPTRPSRPAVHAFDIDPGLATRLRAVSERHGVGLFSTILTGFAIALSRHAAQPEVVVAAAGPAGPMLPLRLDLDGDPAFTEALRRTDEVRQEAYAHRGTPFEHLVRMAMGDQGPGPHPLRQVAFRFLAEPVAERTQADAPMAWEMECTVTPRGDTFDCALRYAANLWEPASAERLCRSWLAVLETSASDPGRRIGDVPYLSDEDRELLGRWNATERDLPPLATVDRLFQEWAGRTPDAVALVDRRGEWTYGRLDARAAQVAHALVAAGVAPDMPVGLHFERSADLVIGMLAVLKAGGACVMLDPDYPEERLTFMTRDTGLAAVVTRDGPPPWLSSTGVPVVSLAATPDRDVAGPAPRSQPEGLASIVFTSGSTGRPKGVGIPHRGIVRLITRTDYVKIGTDDVLVHLGDPAFDITSFEVWGALCNGARVVVLPGDEPLGPEEVMQAMARHRPTILALTATLFHRVADLNPAAFSDLRYLFVVGEVMDPGHTRRVLTHGRPQRLLNGYGPTENSTFSTCHLVDDLPDDVASVPIGPAIGNTTLHVLDAEMRQVPIGAPGELYVGGAGLARGYMGRPALTAERFVPDPFGPQPGRRLYRTGDLVRWLPGGVLQFLGRIDQQVKVRGYRIEPGEIEAAVLADSAVRECLVRLVEVNGDRRLVAYVVPAPGARPSAAALLEGLRRRLPSHMLPNHVVMLDGLPTTSSGKLDALALPGVEASERASDGDTIGPRTPVEAELREIWSEVLDVPGIGIHDDFFLIGGHSLLATTVVAATRERFGVDLPLRSMFATPTIAGLAVEIGARRREAGGPPDELDDLVAELAVLAAQEKSTGDGTEREDGASR